MGKALILIVGLVISGCAGSGGMLDPTLSPETRNALSQQFISNLMTEQAIQSQSYNPPTFAPVPFQFVPQ